MAVSKEVQLAVDEIHRERDALRAAYKANELQASQLSDLKSQIQALKPGTELSEEDKKALLDAVNDVGETNEALAEAVPANVATAPVEGGQAGGAIAPTPPPNDPTAARPDPIAGTGLAGNQVPLMPNMAFDPTGGINHGPGDAGQPNQAPVIETAGGFIVSGGGNTARAPGSRPESPSSSMVVPTDPDAKAPVSTADEVKSGLGDSSQNALIGNDLKPVADGPGIVGEPSPAAAQKEQDRQDGLNAEMDRRRANPLNLSDEDLRKQQEADAGKGTDDDTAKERAAAQQAQAAGSGQAPASPAS